MKCPGCGAEPPETAVPKETHDAMEDRHGTEDWWDPDAWWCPSCIAAKVIAAHTDDCRCAGCRPRRRTAA